jgi:hypothetical protein
MKKVLVTIMVALFATVVVGQTKTLIKPQNLPRCGQDWVKLNMKGFTIDKAYKIENKSSDKTVKNIYYGRAIKGKEMQWLSFDPDCKNVKKITVAEAEKQPPIDPPVKTGTEKEKPKPNEPSK